MQLRRLALLFIGLGILTACTTPLPTPTATFTVVPTRAATVTPTSTRTPIPPTLDPAQITPSATSALAAASPNIDATLNATFIPTPLSVLPGDPPPFTIQLPKDWRYTYTLVPLQDQLGQTTMHVASYAGPLPGNSTGFLYALWKFPSITPIDAQATPLSVQDLQHAILMADGSRLLRGTLIDISCTVGNYGQTSFQVGGLPAVGQRFQVTGCQDGTPELAGWYAGVRQNGVNILFYAYVQPVGAYNNGQGTLQSILDSVVFSAAPITTPGSAVPTTGTPLPNASSPARVSPTTTPALS